MGELRTLRERVFMREDGKALEKIGPTAFGQALKAMLAEHFPDVGPNGVRFVCDPGGVRGRRPARQ
jgi:stage V sporulation protein SpoVS